MFVSVYIPQKYYSRSMRRLEEMSYTNQLDAIKFYRNANGLKSSASKLHSLHQRLIHCVRY